MPQSCPIDIHMVRDGLFLSFFPDSLAHAKSNGYQNSVFYFFTFACLTISHDYSTPLIKRLFISIITIFTRSIQADNYLNIYIYILYCLISDT